MHANTLRLFKNGLRVLFPVVFGLLPVIGSTTHATAGDRESDQRLLGKELFVREWLPNDPRSHGGDGLGPVFNDSSCVACHNQGGVGGGGSASKNVDIVSATSHLSAQTSQSQTSLTSMLVRNIFGLESSTASSDPKVMAARRKQEREHLARLHPGFRSAKSVVLHRFGTNAEYAEWRQGLAGTTDFAQRIQSRMNISNVDMQLEAAIIGQQVARNDFQSIQIANARIQQVRSELGGIVFTRTSSRDVATLTITERNPIALFGDGLIDAIPDRVIEQAAQKKYQNFPSVEGRVCRLKDGKIGRFGWKAQKASLYDFAMTACAVELGLHVPDHPQSGVPLNPDYRPSGFDMTQKECDALAAYLSSLPAPRAMNTSDEERNAYVENGSRLFASVGCAACHSPELGDVDGLYSDLLLHDLGQDLVDTGDYGVFVSDSPGEEFEELQSPELTENTNAQDGKHEKAIIGARRIEWRTPPLWGCRDSAPYMHDGRAQTLDQAIAFHGGEAAASARAYFLLKTEDRQKVTAFLKSLVAPQAEQIARAAP